MPTRNINLTDHFDRFVDKQIEAGQYRNASEVLRAGLRLLEKQGAEDRAKLKMLKTLINDGLKELDQGKGIELKDEHELSTFMQELGRQAVAKSKSRMAKK